VRPATGSFGNLPTSLTMTRVSASLAVFSPNGDGHNEQTTISYTLSVPAHVTATLTGANGVVLSTLLSDDKPAGKNSFVFRAEGLPDGAYGITLVAQSLTGKTVTASVPLVVNRTLAGYSATPTVFSPNRDGRRDTIAFPFSLAYSADAELRIETRAGEPVATAFSGVLPAGAQRLTWDGATAGGTRLPDGSYRAILRVTDSIGTVTQTVAFTSDTTAPRISILSLRRLRFRVSEKSTVTLLVNGRRIRKIQHGTFHVPFRGVPRTAVFFALDPAGNRSPTLRYPPAP
jgi:flagellar hook assembly protein FlgD